jgi:hypothetical protein
MSYSRREWRKVMRAAFLVNTDHIVGLFLAIGAEWLSRDGSDEIGYGEL